ncbi:ATP-grasp domain-containing protein [Flavobacterium gawalongense]|uniref:ATP-grasp domain-containing protein n=1 Tax=Flavobacterium gawalongense TaxID=2594432 RepID=A0A553BGH6_9FLAO|nr:ATP-grasp domain-containing protein [Flavobacterium gawalongense]TRX00020.1 ATP-grasp domain-containing protein [Flavobacterium gawalongense]TRX04750.1 ATP-grasp domain-containing protein [Flavobacterium gawalongense]TRX07336.1 ATP-grasp domain-containing protein [Flavobacterium gawalongense]TRX08353.1 ATP-grasp domain-containing protein [Flavobacterium gawalongense]TRX24458.1 ATP-grasp domain-containing protein [Flavobacterium gawalongense]
MENSKTFLCISNYFKGADFLINLKKSGNKVYLVTSEKLRDKPWPHQYIDEIFYMEGQDVDWNLEHLLLGVGNFMKSTRIDAIVALDDYDVEKATYLRENLRIDGMGQTTGRYFRDKLAMRMRAKSCGIPIPAFCSLFNDHDINTFADTIPAPWVLKPRSEASATGIIKVYDKESLWIHINEMGNNRFKYLLEQFKPGDVYHCDSLISDSKVIFSLTSKYLATPMEISQGGGVFRSANIPYNAEDDKAIKKINEQVLKGFGLKHGAAHTEFIKCKEDGQIYFLETSSRVGGAHLAEMVAEASNINLWKEWAAIEDALAKETKYTLPKVKKEYAGIVLTLSKFQHPDLSSFSDPEVCFRVPLEYHAGLIVKSDKQERVLELLEDYGNRLATDFTAVVPQNSVSKLH